MNIEFDKEIEVTKEQYQKITHNFCGVVAHRVQDDKYYIKLWSMKYASGIQKILEIKN